MPAAGEAGYEVHYCHESVLYHLESVSRGRRSKEIERNAKLFRERWNGRARRDDIDYYVADGLLKVRYRDVYPVGFELAPELAFVSGAGARGGRPAARAAVARGGRPAEGDRPADRARGRARSARRRAAGAIGAARRTSSLRASAQDAHRQLLARVREVELQIHDLQSRVSAPPTGRARGATAGAGPRSRPPSTFATAT